MRKLRTDAWIVQDFIDFSLAWLDKRHYALTVDTDMAAWVRTMALAQSMDRVNPTFDPRFNPLSPENSFWLDVKSGSRTIATSAARLFVTDDYLALKRSTRLWYDPPRPEDGELEISAPLGMPAIRGRVGHEGGLWIHPDHRKRGLSVILPHLNRALCLREWNVDWQTGMTLRDIGESHLAERAYGFPHAAPCFEGRTPLKPYPERLFIVYMSREELLAGLDTQAVAGLLPDRDQEADHAAMRVQER